MRQSCEGEAVKEVINMSKDRTIWMHETNWCRKCVFFRKRCTRDDYADIYHDIIYGRVCNHFIPSMLAGDDP